MSELTPRLGLPLLMAAQAQKHVTHNEALVRLDHVTQLSLVALEATAPPAEPEEGQIWALGPAPTGDWAGEGGNLALWFDGAWQFITPGTGWQATLGTAIHVFDGTDWVAPDLPVLDNLPGLGINASPDATNRLSVAAEATLLNHEGAGHQLKLNKATPGDTASLLFQTGFSGRAEMGTAGSDDWSLKVSADGSTWHDGLVVARASGALSAPNGLNAANLTRAGSPVYAQSTILGTVSQSAGVPTGAIIQRGSNSNGRFVRFADGTQICTREIDYDTGGTTGPINYAFPADFSPSRADYVGCSIRYALGGGDLVARRYLAGRISESVSVTNSGFWQIRAEGYSGGDIGTLSFSLYAFGRWF